MTRKELDTLIRNAIWDGIVIGGLVLMAAMALASNASF